MKVKICGITTVEDALTAADAGADFIGLNFYAGSPRAISPDRAKAITMQLPAEVDAVGLFVNASAKQIRELCHAAALGTVQLHGEEPPELLAELAEFRIIRAFRCGKDGLAPVHEYLARCRRAGRVPDFVLVDAHRPGRYGGTGASPPWDVVAREYDRDEWPPLLLAGGLTPANVAEAIERVHPSGVDTASGVEAAPGRKDPEKVRAFVRAARAVATGHTGRT
jgi:phosphoribosylanthranilate isomerase